MCSGTRLRLLAICWQYERDMWLALIDVVIPISFEPGRVEEDARVRAQGTQVVATLRLDDERTPSAAIFGGLVFQALTDLVEAGWLHARDVRACSRTVFERQGKWQSRNEVDIADIDEQLPAVESKLAESEVSVNVRVGRVEDRRFH